MRRYYKKVWERIRKDFRASLGEQMIGVLLALAILAYQIAFGVIHPSDVRANFWSIAYPYLLLMAAFFVWHVVRVPAKIDEEQLSEEQRLRDRCSQLENEIESKTPLLSVVVHDALVVPIFFGVHVFLDAEVSNERFGTQAIIRGYQLQLERNGSEYVSDTIQTDLSNWQIYDVVDIGDDGRPNIIFENIQALTDLALDINHLHPIVSGVPRRGWLHFSMVAGLWPMEDYHTGASEYHEERKDTEGNVIEPGKWLSSVARRMSTKSAKGIRLTIFAPGGSTGSFEGVVNHSGRREIRHIPEKKVDVQQLL